MSRFLSVIGLLTTFLFVASCRSTEDGPLAEKHALYLNQSLLKEAVSGMSRIWGTPIELEPEVETMKDLWVDYSTSSEVTLKSALDEILYFIKTKHGVALRWRETNGRIVIERQN